METELKKVVVLMSGGIDSSTLAAKLDDEGVEVIGLTIDYGQLSQKEIFAAEAIASELNITQVTLQIKQLGYFLKSSLTDKDIPITEEFNKDIIVPFRNGIFLAIAAGYAVTIGAVAIAYAGHRDDAANFPDCTMPFVLRMESAILTGTAKDIEVMLPFFMMKKKKIVQIAKKLGVPLIFTWSCYAEGEYHCGKCESCNNRKKAFKEAGIDDPTEYRQ